ncbi:MAG: Reverse transcriptase [bacterium]|nr:Reverse transcriptase [bacterium]
MPVAFHVFATLWIQKVGHRFEQKLSTAARGNRLRRSATDQPNALSLGSCTPYLHPYCKWRDDGISAIRDALDKDKAVIAITADAISFYHRIDPRFMLHEEFFERLDIELNGEERRLHNLFVESLLEWAEATPLRRGLPVGLVASAVIANVALFELDAIIERQIVPLYYGRYVDDIILVLENSSGFSKTSEIWNWLIRRSDGALSIQENEKHSFIRFSRPYLNGSEIDFGNNKNRTFLLSGQAGKTLLASIERQIRSRTSEWRSLPDLPSDSTQVESVLISAIQANGDAADSLRKTDRVSVRRAGIALQLRDVEAYNRALPPERWSAKRYGFLDAFIRHVLILPTFFDFFSYLPRVIELAVSCGDFEHVLRILDALEKVLADLDDCSIAIKASYAISNDQPRDLVIDVFRQQLQSQVTQGIEGAFPFQLTRAQRKTWRERFRGEHSLFARHEIKDLQQSHREYIKRDIAYRPLKQLLFPKELTGIATPPLSRKALSRLPMELAVELLPESVTNGVATLAEMANIRQPGHLPEGILFPTRPPSIQDLYILHKKPFSKRGVSDIESCLLALRGFKPEGRLPCMSGPDENSAIVIPLGDVPRHKVRIAVSSWKTDLSSWVAAITGDSDPDDSRIDRLYGLIHSVIGCRSTPDYLLLPELSLPPQWFLAVAGKLRGKGISLICGVEYLHAGTNLVRNQVWAALTHDALGFPTTMVYQQDKQRPAQQEEVKLKQIGGRALKPLVPWDTPPIINHGEFQFSLLICSELTNIKHRASLRGKVDALFVPEWNRDTESFRALVQSAALDVHAYIVQCNDRQYGDSRIRVPHKNEWERDAIRVKGGLDDYYVVGEIDIAALRRFQSSHRSSDGPFKPVPDGFEISDRRRMLPEA